MKKKGKFKKVFFTIFISLIVILAGGIGGAFFYIRSMGRFLDHTAINGHDVSDMTADQAYDVLKKSFSETRIVVEERGETSFDQTLEELGFYLEESSVKELVRRSLAVQNSNPVETANSFFRGRDIYMDLPSSVNEDIFASRVNNDTILNARIPNVNATLEMDADRNYQIVPEIYGTEFNDEDLQYELRTAIAASIANGSGNNTALSEGNIKIDFPEKIYKAPDVLSTDPSLKELGDIYNQFSKTEITYLFGSQTEVLDWDTMKTWLLLDQGNPSFDYDKVASYVTDLAERYNTRHLPRDFVTTYGSTVSFSSGLNEYGYYVDQEAECDQIIADLYANTPVQREPMYVRKNSYENPLFYRREGYDDLNGTYVEVNISAQHLWFYKNGSLIVESDFVSGCVANGTPTQTGVFPLAYKKSPDVLVGGNANNGYSTPVNYWMPFHEGQGLHDATWRGSFGGSIYQYSGSHGCVNLPLWAAAAIYESIEPGMAIIIYK